MRYIPQVVVVAVVIQYTVTCYLLLVVNSVSEIELNLIFMPLLLAWKIFLFGLFSFFVTR